MKCKYFFSLALVVLFLLGAGCNNEALPGDLQIDYEEDVAPLITDNSSENLVRGSCNVIAEKSTCIDYRGSMWGEQDMKLNCEGVGTWSKNTCPYSDIGGCMSGDGTITELVVWHYNRGANPITPEDAQYASMACNSTPMGRWVTPEQVDFAK